MMMQERALRQLIREFAESDGEWVKIVGYEWDDQHNDAERQTQGGELHIDFTHSGSPYRATAYVYAYTLGEADVIELITEAIGAVDEENTLDMYLSADDVKGFLGPMLGKIMDELRASQDSYQQAAAAAGEY